MQVWLIKYVTHPSLFFHKQPVVTFALLQAVAGDECQTFNGPIPRHSKLMDKSSEGNNSNKGSANEYHLTTFSSTDGASAEAYYYVNGQNLDIGFTPGGYDRIFQVILRGGSTQNYKANAGRLCSVDATQSDVQDIYILT